MWRNRSMPDQAAALAIVDSPPTLSERAGRGLDAAAGARVIPLDTRRRRPSPAAVASSRAAHPSQLWADSAARLSERAPLRAQERTLSAVPTPS